MSIVTVPSKFQAIIPEKVRDDVGLEAGTKMEVISYVTRIEFILIQLTRNLKALFRGLNNDIDRNVRYFEKEKKSKKPRRRSPA